MYIVGYTYRINWAATKQTQKPSTTTTAKIERYKKRILKTRTFLVKSLNSAASFGTNRQTTYNLWLLSHTACASARRGSESAVWGLRLQINRFNFSFHGIYIPPHEYRGWNWLYYIYLMRERCPVWQCATGFTLKRVRRTEKYLKSATHSNMTSVTWWTNLIHVEIMSLLGSLYVLRSMYCTYHRLIHRGRRHCDRAMPTYTDRTL